MGIKYSYGTVTCLAIVCYNHSVNATIIAKIKFWIIFQKDCFNVNGWLAITSTGRKQERPSLCVYTNIIVMPFQNLSHVIRYATYLNNSKIGCLDEADRNKRCFQDKMFVNTQTSHLKTYLPFSLKIGWCSYQGFSWVWTASCGLANTSCFVVSISKEARYLQPEF